VTHEIITTEWNGASGMEGKGYDGGKDRVND